MFIEYAESILELSSTLIALVICLFRYISTKKRGWIYLVAFFLCELMSIYFWTSYLIIMKSYPTASNLLTYWGWNASYAVVLLLVIHFKEPGELRYFHLLMLLPIPLNLYQLSLYLPYGGRMNSIYQVTVCTITACLSLQSILWYINKKTGKTDQSDKTGKEAVRAGRFIRSGGGCKPYVAIAALLFVASEFGMWTSSCFGGWIRQIYYLSSFIRDLDFFLLVWAVDRSYPSENGKKDSWSGKKTENILKLGFLTVVLISVIGGVQLNAWIKEKIAAGIQDAAGVGTYDIIAVILFVVSLVIAAFAIAIIFVVSFSHEAAMNEKLREEKTAAEQANAAKSDFLANVSHEIRTPINAVLGMNEMILRDSQEALRRLPEKKEQIQEAFAGICTYAGNIESAGNNLLSIINDILDFSKIEAGKLELTEYRYKLSSVLNDVSNMTEYRIQDKDLSFEVDVDETLPDELFGDEVRVRQVMINVLSNAAKYTKEGWIRLSVYRAEEDRGLLSAGSLLSLAIDVEDTGIGIREEDIGKLFGKFERADLAQNKTIEGTGLGLAITKSLLDMMGGSIEVESVYGKGSIFRIRLPQKIVSMEPVGNFREKYEKTTHETKEYKESFHASDARILIVDDTRMNLIVAAKLLQKTKIQIDTALSGSKAIESAHRVPYDVILMDQRMPGMDGTQALHHIREDSDGASRETPVICLTADAVSGARDRYLKEGFTDYLTKPVNSTELEKMLMKYLPEEKVQAEASEEPARKVQAEASEEPARKVQADAGGSPGDKDFISFRISGIDPEMGLGYCGNDSELYREMLEEFCLAAEEKLSDIEKAYQSGDYKNYEILVHALKSTSRLIGAKELSDTAADLEDAAAKGDEEHIHGRHREMTDKYRQLSEALSASFGKLKEGSAAEKERDSSGSTLTYEDTAPELSEDDILEFLPED